MCVRLLFLGRDLPDIEPHELSLLRTIARGARVRPRPELIQTIERLEGIGVLYRERRSGAAKLSVLGACVLDANPEDQ